MGISLVHPPPHLPDWKMAVYQNATRRRTSSELHSGLRSTFPIQIYISDMPD